MAVQFSAVRDTILAVETLDIHGVTYKKASAIARDLGYTADYVGQLCRGGKIDAQLVGRSWYVNTTSIMDHKATRYRSTSKKTQEAIQQQKATQVRKNYIHHVRPTAVAVYEPDEASLVPEVSKKTRAEQHGRIEVALAEAETLKVASGSEPYRVTVGDKPSIRFRGSLSVASAEAEEENAEPEATKAAEATVVVQVKKQAPQKPVKQPLRRSGAIAMRRESVEEQSAEAVQIPIGSTEQPQRIWVMHTAVAGCCGAVLLIASHFAIVETQIAQASGATVSYSFELEALINESKTVINKVISFKQYFL